MYTTSPAAIEQPIALDETLTFYTSADSPITVQTVQLSLKPTNHQVCVLTIAVSSEQYQQIYQEKIFHLDATTYQTDASFHTDCVIRLEIYLDPKQVPRWAESSYPETTTDYLTLLQQNDLADTSLYFTEYWFCQRVYQIQNDREVGYRTLWAYANPAQVNQLTTSGTEATAVIANLFKQVAAMTQTAMQQELPDWQQRLENLFDEVTVEFDRSDATSISEVVAAFFDADDWEYVQIDAGVLQLAFIGNSGRWTCLANCNDAAQQFVFYSLYPFPIPADRRSLIAEFLTRANDRLLIGNFELDFSDGEVRYKTSIDVEGDRLTPALLNSIVYTNVLTMDTYLPGITAVMQGERSPLDAIAQIEADD